MPVDGFEGQVKEFDFALGHVTGVRGFKQDSLGRLIGVSRPRVFRPGVNQAKCPSCKTKELADCACGYYAYFQQEEYGKKADNSFYGGTIGGIIKGHGRTVVGTKGFRAEKAELLGLFPIDTVYDKKAQPTKPDQRSPFRFLYPSTEWFRKRNKKSHALNENTIAENWGATVFFTSIPLILAMIVTPFISGQVFTYIMAGAALYVPWGIGFINRAFAACDLSKDKGKNFFYRKCRPGKTAVQVVVDKPVDPFEKLRILYPEVPVYPSFHAAVKAHPLTSPEEHKPPEPTPDNTDGFWDIDLPENQDGMSGGWITANSGIYINMQP